MIERFIQWIEPKRKDFNAREFRAKSPVDKLKGILEEPETESLQKDILLGSDPMVIQRFRGRIWPIVVSKCGSLTCHGAPKGQGQFKLLNIAARNERIDYSNFLILNEYYNSRGRMLDRDNVSDSLVLHYGLPREKADFKHPSEKQRVPAPFASVTDRNYLAVKQWIESLKGGPNAGRYDVKYQAPYGPKPKPPLILGPTTKPKPADD